MGWRERERRGEDKMKRKKVEAEVWDGERGGEEEIRREKMRGGREGWRRKRERRG